MTNPNRLSAGCLLVAIQLSSIALADHQETDNAYYAYAEVIETQPIIRQSTQRTPRKECRQVRSSHTASKPRRNKTLPTLFGGLLGGVIGHQFGGGNGKTALTIAGAFAGASIANNANHRPNNYSRHSYRKNKRCTIGHDVQNFETIDGYLVTYLYRGKQFTRTMGQDPGSTLRIRVQVEPVGDAYASNDAHSSKNHF